MAWYHGMVVRRELENIKTMFLSSIILKPLGLKTGRKYAILIVTSFINDALNVSSLFKIDVMSPRF